MRVKDDGKKKCKRNNRVVREDEDEEEKEEDKGAEWLKFSFDKCISTDLKFTPRRGRGNLVLSLSNRDLSSLNSRWPSLSAIINRKYISRFDIPSHECKVHETTSSVK